MEINIANSTLGADWVSYWQGVNTFTEYTQNIVIVICLTTAHKEKPLPLGFCGIRGGWGFFSIAKPNYKHTAGPSCYHMRLFFLLTDQHKA